jgi:hypothetical protein
MYRVEYSDKGRVLINQGCLDIAAPGFYQPLPSAPVITVCTAPLLPGSLYRTWTNPYRIGYEGLTSNLR